MESSNKHLVHNNLISNFLDSLSAEKISKVTYTNYKSDLKFFVSWYETNLTPLDGLGEAYVNYLKETGLSESTINRRLSTLRKYTNFLYINSVTASDLSVNIRNFHGKDKSNTLKGFSLYMAGCGMKNSTQVNYLSDVQQFLDWVGEDFELTAENILVNSKLFIDSISKAKRESTVKRYRASLAKYAAWVTRSERFPNRSKNYDTRPYILFIVACALIASPILSGTFSSWSENSHQSEKLSVLNSEIKEENKNIAIQLPVDAAPDTNDMAGYYNEGSDLVLVSSLDEHLGSDKLIEDMSLPLFGKGTILSGKTETTIYQPDINSESIVLLTPYGEPKNVDYSVREQGSGYFVVSMLEPIVSDFTFSWLVQN